MNLSGMSISRPVFTTMIMMAIVLFGAIMYRSLSVDQYPEVDLPIVTVVTVYPGADPATIENQVSIPVEDALNTLAGLDELRSVSLPSVSQVVVQFDLGTDINVAAQDIRDALARVELPDQTEEPLIQKVDLGAQAIIQLGVTGSGDIEELVEYVDDTLKPALQRIDGVGSIDIFGGREREIHVWLDPARLAATGLTIDDVSRMLGAQNIEIPGGRVNNGEQELSLRATARVREPADLEQTALTTINGAVIRLGDIGRVEDSLEEARSLAFLDGRPALGLDIRKQSGANTVDVAESVRASLPALVAAAPPGIGIETVLDGSVKIRSSIETVQLDIVLGGLLAVAIILLFLRDWRATLISATALPVSIIGSFAFVSAMGFTLNMMTTLALSLSVGILIDDAIVVIENIARRRTALGESPMDAARNGTDEIMLAVLATTLSIVAVFVPVAFMDGMIGQFFFEFGLTVAFAVLMSLFVSFTLTPMLSARFLVAHDHHEAQSGVSGAIQAALSRIENLYRVGIRWALAHRGATVGMAVLSLVATVGLATMLDFEFVPQSDDGQFTVSIELPPEASLQETEQRALSMAARIADMGGVEETFTTIGGGVQEKVNTATILVKLPHKTARSFSQSEAISVTRALMADEPSARITVAPLEISAVGGGRSADLELRLQASSMEALAEASEKIQAALRAEEGIVDVDSSLQLGKPELEVRVDPGRAADLGVLGAQVATTVRSLVAGVVPTTFADEGEQFDVRVQLDQDDRASVAAVSRAQLRSGGGQLVHVGDVADINQITGPSQIDRTDRQREVIVYANLDGRSLGDASTAALALAREAAPPGVRVALSGDSERLADTQEAMLTSIFMALALVYMILASQFESFVHPFTIMMSVPFAFIGAFAALVLTGSAMSIFGMIGLIMLVGLVTKNAILLVDFAIAQLQAGHGLMDALEEAGATRLMPILMTTAAMVFGMLPVALGHGDGGEVRAPMGLAVIGGLLSSMVLTLVVVPVIFSLIESARHRIGQWINPAATAPATATVVEA